MIDPENIPPVADIELLARFATQSGQFRRSDFTVKQDLFMPHPHRELSVLRHRDASMDEIWQVGHSIASELGRTLYGRADIRAASCNIEGLRAVARPIPPKNPNHAEIEGWPAKIEDKKALAIKLAVAAGKLIAPPPGTK